MTSTATRAARGHQLTQEFQPLRRQLTTEKIDACQVAARPSQAGDKTKLDRVFADQENDGDRRGCRLGRQRRGGHRSRRSRRPGGEPDRPPATAIDHICLPPSGIRSSRSRPRHSRFPLGPGEIHADGPRIVSGDVALRNPITGIAGCCARAASGHAAAAPPSSVMNSRRLIRSPRRRGRARRRHVQAKSLGSLEVDDEFEFGRLLHREIGRLLALENSVDIVAGAANRWSMSGP